MDRWACVDIPELPLQLLGRHHPEWRGLPVVVVDHDQPNGVVLWANEKARSFKILPGLRFATGLSLCPDLRAGEVSARWIQEATEELVIELRCFSPRVEAADEAGVFWVDASGLRYLYASLSDWAQALRQQVQRHLELELRIAVGFSRFGSYAVARSMSVARAPIQVFTSARAELKEAARVPLARLKVSAKLRDALDKLGVRTVGALARLRAGDLKERFGSEAFELHRRISGLASQPLDASIPEEPIQKHLHFDHVETSTERLLFTIRHILVDLLRKTHDRHQWAARLKLYFHLDTGEKETAELKVAQPTLDLTQWTELVRLRLETLEVKAGIRDVGACIEGITTHGEQLRAYYENPKRDLNAAARAFDRLRAEFGDDCVVKATLQEGHLPEANFRWQPLHTLEFPSAKHTRPEHRPLVRRFFSPALLLPYCDHPGCNKIGLLKGAAAGPMIDIQGPLSVSGGWWVREVRRDYYFIQLQNEELLWVYFDHHRRRWYLQGEVA